MTKRSNISYISLFFVVALIISSWFAVGVTKNILAQKQLQKSGSDFFMHDVVYTQMAEDGSIQNQLRSPRMVHYPLNDTYTFNSPQLVMVGANKHIWKINADYGSGKKSGQEIYLWDNVNITQQASESGREFMRVVTSAATIYPQQKIASTDRPLTITQAGTVVSAIGARVDFHTSTIKLLSKVEGQYAPTGNKP